MMPYLATFVFALLDRLFLACIAVFVFGVMPVYTWVVTGWAGALGYLLIIGAFWLFTSWLDRYPEGE